MGTLIHERWIESGNDALQRMLSLGVGELEEGEEKWEGMVTSTMALIANISWSFSCEPIQAEVVRCFPFFIVTTPFKVRFVASILDYASWFRNTVGLGTGGAGSE